MEEIIARILKNLFGRLDGPFHLRLLLQPTMATIFAVRDGLKDARSERAPYFWAVFTHPAHRAELLRDGWKSVSKVFIIAFVLDVIYQLIVLRWVYPGEVLLVASLLALVPYLLIRGPVNRIGQPWFRRRRKAEDPQSPVTRESPSTQG